MKNTETLRDAEKTLLIDILKKQRPDLIEKALKIDLETPDIEAADQMRMALIEESGAIGFFDPNWELTEYGMQVERLIEHFDDLYYWPDIRKQNSWLKRLIGLVKKRKPILFC